MGADPGFDITASDRRTAGSTAGCTIASDTSSPRTDMSVALPLLAQRLPDLEADGPGDWLPVSGNTGPVRFPLRFRAAAAQ